MKHELSTITNLLKVFKKKALYYDEPLKVAKAAAGEEVFITLEEENVGRCLTRYTTLRLNPKGPGTDGVIRDNFGGVAASHEGAIDGVCFQIFNYEVDSSD